MQAFAPPGRFAHRVGARPTEVSRMIDPGLWRDRALNTLLPLVQSWRGTRTRDAYQALLVAYQRDYLAKRRRFPAGVPYRVLSRQDVAPGTQAYRLQAPAGVSHHCGNTLVVNWRNRGQEVEALLAGRGWDGNAPMRFRTASSPLAPGAWIEAPLRQILTQHLDLRVPYAGDMAHSHSHDHHDHDDHGPAGHRPPQPTLAASLAQADPGGRLSPQTVLAHQARHHAFLQPRSYSLSGIDRPAGGEVVEILVSQVSDTVLDPADQLQVLPGRASGYLASLEPGRDVLHAWPLAFPMSLAPHQHPAPPLLVIATGIAAAGPLCEWQAQEATHPGRAFWLLCGLRRFDPGQPYLNRLLDFAAARPACRLDIALSRDAAPATGAPWPANVVFHDHSRVQDVLARQPDRFHAHYQAQGDVAVIGHQSMGAAIQDWLKQWFLQTGLAADADAAGGLLRGMEKALRVQYSLSGR